MSSSRLTRARDANHETGHVLLGRASRKEAIRAYREHYQVELERAKIALSFKDEDLVVETYVGVIVEKNLEEVE